jgi:branched-chain amino acid transport system ATP-binding protein
MTLLEVVGLSAFYGDFQALFDVSLDVSAGQTVGIVGANGAGKSTLLRAIAGLVGSKSGDIRFEGETITRRAAHERVRLGISLVPEGRRIFPSLTTHENLLVGAYSGAPGHWTISRVYDLFPRLAARRHLPGTALSGGEQQMLAIGRALMANPRLLLLDEISLGLAPAALNLIYGAIPGIAESGATIVVVEQDLGRALGLSDHLYCLLEGRVSLHGRPADLELPRLTAAYFGR